ncbi:MAG: hypothetical protein EXR71_20640 [Myxococcales bacterium]|nr:hypothetical protein [Myxococcales bacterium]
MAEALSWEQMPGTSGGEEDPKRPPALHAFFLGHPEYADPAHREALAGEACGMDNTEAAHAWLKNPPPRTPLILEVTSESWKVFVAHSSHHCTSDDWAYYTSEANTAASQRGADVGYADPTNDAVVVRLHGQELARIRGKEA